MTMTKSHKIENVHIKEYVEKYCYNYHVYYEDIDEKFVLIADLYDDERKPFLIFEKEGRLYNSLGYEL